MQKERHSISNSHTFYEGNLQNASKEPSALEHRCTSGLLEAWGQASYKADRDSPISKEPGVAGLERSWQQAGMGTSKALPGCWSGFDLLKFSKNEVHTSFIWCRENLQKHLN